MSWIDAQSRQSKGKAMAKITYGMLVAQKACLEQREKFKELFPEGVEVTEEKVAEFSSVFDFDWAARNLLKAPLLAAYEEAKAPLWAAYEEAKAVIFARLFLEQEKDK